MATATGVCSSETWETTAKFGSEVFGPRLGTFAVHDPAGDRMVLFGGYNGAWLDDTWSLGLEFNRSG